MLPGLELGHRGFQRNASRWAVYRGAPALPARATCLPRPPWVLTLQRQGTVQASVPPSIPSAAVVAGWWEGVCVPPSTGKDRRRSAGWHPIQCDGPGS